MLVLQHLPLDQPLLADGAYGDRRRAGEATAAISAEPARADLTVTEAMNAASAGMAPIACSTQFGQINTQQGTTSSPTGQRILQGAIKYNF